MICAAAASFEYTPAPGLVLQGHWSDVKSDEVILPLEGRVLALRRGQEPPVVLAAVDGIGVPLEFTDRVRQEAQKQSGLPRVHLLLATSHTHGAPAMLRVMGMVPDADFMRTFESKLVEAIVRAVKECREPVRFATGASEAYFHTNRRPLPGMKDGCANRAGVFDPRVRVLRLDRRDGSTLATLFCFSCHPTSIAGSTGKISSDYPGAARRAIEAQTASPALFMPGCFGNIRPAYLEGQGFRNATVQELLHSGQVLADAVRRAMEGRIGREEDRLAFQQADLILEYQPTDPDERLKELMEALPDLAGPVIPPWHARVKKLLEEGWNEPLVSRMQAVAVGPVVLVAVPGEPVQEIGFAIERQAAERGIVGVWAMGYCNDMPAYLVTQRHKAEGGYEPTAWPFFDKPFPFVDEQRAIEQVAAGLLEKVIQSDASA